MPDDLARFEQALESPPHKVIHQLNGSATATWQHSQVGYAGRSGLDQPAPDRITGEFHPVTHPELL